MFSLRLYFLNVLQPLEKLSILRLLTKINAGKNPAFYSNFFQEFLRFQKWINLLKKIVTHRGLEPRTR